MSRLRKIAAHFTLCPHYGPIPRAILTFNEEGRLIALDTDVSKMDSMHGIEFYSGILIPGMVNAHCHLELSYLQGKIARGSGLSGFVRRIADIRRNTPLEERIYAADVQDTCMYKEGIVAVGDICNDSFTFPLKRKSPVFYHNFIELFGIDPAVSGPMLSRGEEIAGRAQSGGLIHSLTPHSVYSLSEPLFENTVRKPPPDKPLSIHFMESPSERELFHNRGAFAERYKNEGLAVDFTRFGSPAGRLTETIPAETPLLLIHNTFVSEEDIDRIHGHFENVTWVICPRSNDYIEGSFPPVDLLRRKGCRIAVGTDSLASNASLSLLEEMKLLTQKAECVSLEEQVGWVTGNGAKALGIASRAGSFEIGKSPGAVLIDHIDWNRMALTRESSARRII